MAMRQTTTFRDLDLRIRLLEHIAHAYSGTEYFAAIEARYASNDRRADVLVVSDHSHAYEIKSDVDRLDRLPKQLSDYRQTFDFSTVVTTDNHVSKIAKMLGKNNGLIVVSDQGAIEIKKPERSGKIFKKNLVAMCSKQALAEALEVAPSSVSLHEIRVLAAKKLSLAELRHEAFLELNRRFRSRYAAFLEEACLPYRETDLTLLRHGNTLATNLLLA